MLITGQNERRSDSMYPHGSGSAYMMQPLAIWLTCVCRPIPCMVGRQHCVPRRLGLWSRAPKLLPVSAASPSMDHEHGIVCQLNSEHQI